MKRKKLLISLLSLVALAATMAVPVMAATTDTTEITGQVSAVIDVTAPGDIDLGSMALGDNTACSATAGTVICNAEDWQVEARDTTGDIYAGYMTNFTRTVALAEKFQISDEGAAYSAADVGITYNNNPTTLPFCVKQEVTSGDQAGSYSIIITFTGIIMP